MIGPTGSPGAAGIAGARGAAGVDGLSVIGSFELPGENCPYGGVKYQAANGISYVCNGADGKAGEPGDPGPTGLQGVPGTPGQDGVSVVSALELPGANCIAGGTKYVSASGASYVCNGSVGATGPAGATGATGAQGFYGLTGAAGPAGPAGPQGIAGLAGATGPQGASGNYLNPLRIAQKRWYDANTVGITVPAGQQPVGMSFDGVYLWVADLSPNSMGTNTVSKINVNTNTLVATYNMPNSRPLDLVFDGRLVWVTMLGEGSPNGSLASIDPNSGTVTPYTSPGGTIAFDGEYVWIAAVQVSTSSSFNGLSKYKGDTLVASYAICADPSAIVSDGHYLWLLCLDQGQLWKFDPNAGVVTATFPVGVNPVALAFDGQNIWLTLDGHTVNGSLVKVSATTGAILGSYPVGLEPSGIVFDGTSIWVSNFNGNTVMKFAADTGARIASYPVAAAPFFLAFDGVNIWVSNSYANVVTKL